MFKNYRDGRTYRSRREGAAEAAQGSAQVTRSTQGETEEEEPAKRLGRQEEANRESGLLLKARVEAVSGLKEWSAASDSAQRVKEMRAKDWDL